MTSDQTVCCSYRNSTSFILFRLTARFARWLVLLLLVIGGSQGAFAQQYPVRVNTFIMPPYSVYLSDYVAPDANNLTVTLNLGDLDFTQYQCKLRVTIEGGNGVLIQTLLGYSPVPIILTGGVPETLYGYDIRQYFNPDNLEFSGIRKTDFLRTGKLPEGFYTFTIEVLDYHRNVVVSNTSLVNAWLVLNDPPLINLPFNGEKVRATDPQNIMFSWTPRHTASPNAAFSTEYKFKLVEIYPVGRNPNDAILASNSIYETTTSATALNYGIIEPLLIPGRQYAFQVQAYDIDGWDLFKNNGRSEVYTFQYGDACLAPEGTDADALDPDRLKFSWEPSELHTEFKLRFRQANKDDWYEQQTFNTSLIVPDLIPNTTYEYQVMGSCGSIEGEYSEVGSVTTPETDDDVFACGVASTDFELSTEPLPFPLVPPLNIETADFRVAVKEVSINPDGTYNGTGWAMIPWFEMATVRVKFSGIRVNKYFRVYQGNITTIYSNNSQFVMGDDLNELDEDGITGEEDEEIEDPLDDFYDDYDFEDTVKVDYDITDVYTDEDGDIVIVYEDANGEQQEEHIEAGEGDILIEDGNGDQWAVDQDGNVEGNPDNTPDPVDPADVDYLVTFKPNPEQRYGFDAKGDYSMGPYDELEINGQEYVVAWKSVELGRNDYVNVVTEKENFPTEVGFQTPTGKTSSIASASANKKQVVVTGTNAGLEETLDAYVVVEEGEETEELVLGRLNVKTYEQLSERLVIVPVNNVAAPNPEEIATALNDIYKQAVVEWRLSIADRFEIDSDMIDGMMDESSGIFSSVPYPMREFNQAYRDRATQYDDNAYYIFLVEGAHANKAGFMPFKRQFGYIFTDELGGTTIAKAIAHELGHGAFRLRHTFSPEDFKAQEGTTDNLMDYTNGTRLKKAQWDLIHEPGEMNGWFEGDEESAYTDPEVLKSAFIELVGDMMCAMRTNGATPVWVWPSTSPLFVPGTVTLFDGKEYRIHQVKKHSGFQSSTFSTEPFVVQDFGDVAELRFEGDNHDWVTVQIYKSDQEAFQTLIRGTEFDQNFSNWIATVKAETNASKIEELIKHVPSCGLEEVTDLDDRVDLIKLILDNISYFDQDGESLVIKLIKDVRDDQIVDFHEKLRSTSYKDVSLLAYILYEMDDFEFIFSDGNSATLIEVFTAQCLNAKLANNNIPDLTENENLFMWAGMISGGSGKYNLYSSSLLSNGQIKYTLGAWYPDDPQSNTETTYYFDPLDDWIVIYPTEDIPHIGYQANTPYVVPAIVLHYLIKEEENSNTRKLVFTTIDIASFAIGVGAISSGIRGWKLAVAIIETTSAGASIALEVFEDDLKESGWTDEEINDLRVATMVMELAGVGIIEGPKVVAKLSESGSRMFAKLQRLGEYGASLKPSVKQKLESLREFLRKYMGEAASGGEAFNSLVNKASSLSSSTFNQIESMLKSNQTIIRFDYGGRVLETAEQFLNEIGTEMYDLVLGNGRYAKFDKSTGRMLYTEGTNHYFIRYKGGNSVANTEQLLSTRITQLRNCLGFNGPQTIKLGFGLGTVKTNPNKVLTFIGKTDQTQLIKNQFGDFKHIEVGETAGSVNLLNMPDTYWNPSTWFPDYNEGWMLRAIQRNDDIYIASEINFNSLYNFKPDNTRYGSYFANELNVLVEAGIKPKNISQIEWEKLIPDIVTAAETKY